MNDSYVNKLADPIQPGVNPNPATAYTAMATGPEPMALAKRLEQQPHGGALNRSGGGHPGPRSPFARRLAVLRNSKRFASQVGKAALDVDHPNWKAVVDLVVKYDPDKPQDRGVAPRVVRDKLRASLVVIQRHVDATTYEVIAAELKEVWT